MPASRHHDTAADVDPSYAPDVYASYPPPQLGPELPGGWADHPPPAPAAPRLRALPSVVLTLVCALVFAASGVLLTQPGSGLDHLLPPDGSVREVVRENRTPAQLEQAVLARSQLNGHGLLAGVVQFNRSAAQLRRTTWLRATVKPAPAPVVIVLAVLDGSLSLDGVSLPGQGLAFHPGVILADSDESAARSAVPPEQRISAVTGTDRAEATAAVAVTDQDDGCRSARIDLPAGPGPVGDLHIALTVCEGQGLTAFHMTSAAGEYGFGPARVTPPAVPVDLAPVASSWQDPARWNPDEHSIHQTGGFGAERLEVLPRGNPVPRPDGGLVLYDEQARDLVALGPPSPRARRLELLWRAHPGGVVSSVLALGELTVAATSEKVVTAYDGQGRRLWSRRFEDVVAGDLRLDPAARRVLLATKDGRVVALDARDGRVVWDRRVANDVQRGVRTAGGRVLVVDATGAAHVLSASDGREVWMSEQFVDVGEFDIDAGTVYLLSRSTIFAFEADSGRPRWMTRITGVSRNAVLAQPDQLLVATEQQIVALDPATGRRRWSSGGGEFLVAQDGVVLTGAEQTLSVRAAADGRELRSWPLRRDVTDAERCGCTPAGPGAAFIVPSGVVWLR